MPVRSNRGRVAQSLINMVDGCPIPSAGPPHLSPFPLNRPPHTHTTHLECRQCQLPPGHLALPHVHELGGAPLSPGYAEVGTRVDCGGGGSRGRRERVKRGSKRMRRKSRGAAVDLEENGGNAGLDGETYLYLPSPPKTPHIFCPAPHFPTHAAGHSRRRMNISCSPSGVSDTLRAFSSTV